MLSQYHRESKNLIELQIDDVRRAAVSGKRSSTLRFLVSLTIVWTSEERDHISSHEMYGFPRLNSCLFYGQAGFDEVAM